MAILATLLAFVAVLGMSALAGWHAAAVHDDPPARSAVTAAAGGVADSDPDNAVHLAAHAIGHAFAVPAAAAPSPPRARVAGPWPSGIGIATAGLDPGSPLRPPQA